MKRLYMVFARVSRRILHPILGTDQRELYLLELQRREEELRRANVAFAHAMDEQKHTESALRRSEERFHLAARATNDVVFEWDFKTDDCWCNEAMAEQFGLGVSGAIDRAVWLDALHPEDRGRVLKGLMAAVAAGSQFLSDEYRFRKIDGSYADVRSHVYIVRTETGQALRMIGATIDITERKRIGKSISSSTPRRVRCRASRTVFHAR